MSSCAVEATGFVNMCACILAFEMAPGAQRTHLTPGEVSSTSRSMAAASSGSGRSPQRDADDGGGTGRASGAPANEVLFAILPERSGQRGDGGSGGAGR